MADSPNAPNVVGALFLASRPRTWIAGVAPVLLGGLLAFEEGEFSVALFLPTLFFSLLIQIGTNFANDAFDFLNGVDTAKRVGPKRAAAAGWLSPKALLWSTALSFLAALFIALPLIFRVGPVVSLSIASLAILSGLLYTGGPRPFGYLGLGELFVALFFGPVALLGTYYVQTLTLPLEIALFSFAPGLFSTALLVANNLRDQEGDAEQGKKTLVVRFGAKFGAWEYTLSLLFPFLLALPFTTFPLLMVPLCIAPIRQAFAGENLPALLPTTARLFLLYTLLFAIGLFL